MLSIYLYVGALVRRPSRVDVVRASSHLDVAVTRASSVACVDVAATRASAVPRRRYASCVERRALRLQAADGGGGASEGDVLLPRLHAADWTAGRRTQAADAGTAS